MLPVLPSAFGSLNGGLAVIIFTLLHLATTTYSTRVHNIHWNSSNPIFRTSNVIEINTANHPWKYDQVNFVCPVYKPGTSELVQEKYIIYSVTKEEYESCRITQPSPKIIAVCNKPNELMYFTITFRSFTPTPGGMEFRPGHDYYFISTSSKNDLHRRVGGGCSTHNMRLIFRVAEDIKDNSISQPAEVATSNEVETPPKVQTWYPGGVHPQDEDLAPYHYPLREVEQAEGLKYNGAVLRRDGRRDSLPPQKEASIMRSSVRRNSVCYILVSSCIALLIQTSFRLW